MAVVVIKHFRVDEKGKLRFVSILKQKKESKFAEIMQIFRFESVCLFVCEEVTI